MDQRMMKRARQQQAALAAIARREWLLRVIAIAAAGCRRSYDRASTVTIAYPHGTHALSPTRDLAAMYLVFLPLVGYDDQNREEPRLAQRWEHSPDYREWTFYLRKDARWHDGVPVTAHDVKFALEILTNPAVGFLGLAQAESATVLDDWTIRVRGDGSFRDEVSCLPRHLLNGLDPAKMAEWEFWNHPVGNGAYRVVRHVPETMMELTANPDYFGRKPRIDRVILKFVGEAGLTELLGARIDVLPDVNPILIPKLAADPRFHIYHRTRPFTSAIYWQTAHPLFQDVHIRQALTRGINRRELLRVVNLPDTLPIIDGLVTPRQFRRGQIPEAFPYDPVQASAMLEAAGWRDRNRDGVREKKGQAFHFTALVRAEGALPSMAVYVQDQLRRLGVQMEVQVMDSNIVTDRLKAGRFEAAVTTFARGLRDWLAGGYGNADAFQLFDKLRALPDPAEQDRTTHALSEILRADMPVTSLAVRTETFLIHRRIRGLSTPWRADPAFSMEDLWIEE